MKVTWLGQAGLLLDDGKHKIMVDPYLSNSVEKVEPKNHRRLPIREEFLSIEPDVMIFTHDHLDHYDPETASVFLSGERKPMTVLCPSSVWQKARKHGKEHNYVLFDRHSEWTEHGFCFSAVKAAHSDPYAIGVIIQSLSDNKTYYITGDTLYNREILDDLKRAVDVIFLPVNGVGNNMNAADAVRFFCVSGAKWAIPYHVGMFDTLSPEIFDHENKIILEAYKEREI